MWRKKWVPFERKTRFFISGALALTVASGCAFFGTSSDNDNEEEDIARRSAPLIVQPGQSIAASGEGRLFAGPLHTCMVLGNGALKCWATTALGNSVSAAVAEWMFAATSPERW